MKCFAATLAGLLIFSSAGATTPIRSNFSQIDVTTEEGLRLRAATRSDGTLETICVYPAAGVRSFVPVKSMDGWWPRLDALSVWDVETDHFSIRVPLLKPNAANSGLDEKIINLQFERGRFVHVDTERSDGVTLKRELLPTEATAHLCVLDR